MDGAIHRAAGPELKAACAALGGARTGEAKITPGFRLPARYVIHAVGPVWGGGARGEPDLLASCYRTALEIAVAHELKAVAFPAISTGVYRFPPDLAAEIAVRTTAEVLTRDETLDQVVFCCFSEAWITRTRALPAGVVSSSFMTWSRRPDSGPMPATV